jgi:hypothetical protein
MIPTMIAAITTPTKIWKLWLVTQLKMSAPTRRSSSAQGLLANGAVALFITWDIGFDIRPATAKA